MGLFDAFRYDGKRALVVGGATGMPPLTATKPARHRTLLTLRAQAAVAQA
ncbi:MAG: hypothetical protein JO085_09280 [Acidimicrobiia bacterium]|nr:hypothetical protein [Acidimicrobiia bacterium]